MYKSVWACMYVGLSVSIYLWLSICVHVCMDVFMYTHMCLCLYVFLGDTGVSICVYLYCACGM